MDDRSRAYLSHKIKTAEEIATAIGDPGREKKAIMCHGVFDIVHPGHIRHLIYAKGKGDILIASLTADRHISKANFRPFVPEDLRAFNLAALEMVDYVVIDPNPTPIEQLRIIRPDYFAKGYEYGDGDIHPKTREEMAVLEMYGGEVIFTPGDIVYSSSRIIESVPPSIGVERLIMELEGEGLGLDALTKALDSFANVRVHVVGDTIIDSFTNCTMIGGGTKTPTLSVRFEERTDFVGGAGVVAKHLSAAGADVTFSTVLGQDDFANFVDEDLATAGVKCLKIVDATRPTTIKNAIVAGGYRLLKVDTLDNRSVSERIVATLCEQLRETAADIVVFSDFRHGIFNRQTIPTLIDSIPNDVLRVADSQVASRWGNILEFQGFDLITPNEREARFALGDQDSVVRPLASKLHKMAKCRTLILKMGERGLLTHRTREEGDPRAIVIVDSFADRVVDAVGAGDALLAYAALAMHTTGNEVVASALGGLAAGIECEIDGNAPIAPDDLRAKIRTIDRLVSYV